MSFSQFIKPYPDGYEDFEVGGTPVTAEILNTNYDGFLLALNSWAAETESDIASKANSSDVGAAFSRVGSDITELRNTISQKSIVSISDLLSAGTKIGTITINGTDYDLYAPSGGGGGSSVSWNQIVSTGTKIATVTIDGIPTDVYVPTPIDELSNLTDVSITNLQDGQIIKWNSTTLKWENSNESGSGTGGHTIIDENGNSMTARAGLQFVGGANVSDDATNNKTIVDLASAGGIDGVFVDTDNVIISTTAISTSGLSYTATEDCFVYVYLWGGNSTKIKINNVEVGANYSSDKDVFLIHLKKGQILTTTSGNENNTYAVYGIQTGTSHSKFQPVIYSLEEIEIGIAPDGKPLYEKTIEISNVVYDSEWHIIPHGILNIDEVVSCIGILFGQDGEFFNVPQYRASTSQGITFGVQGNYVSYINNWYDGAEKMYATIRYTKTTDVAGSGTWTPQGVPAVHYSTEEHIVGTWMGKTLWEKTYSISNTALSNGTKIDIGLTTVETLVNKDVMMIRNEESTSDYFTTFPYATGAGKVGDFRFMAYSGKLEFNGNDSWGANDYVIIYVTLQYTKSS